MGCDREQAAIPDPHVVAAAAIGPTQRPLRSSVRRSGSDGRSLQLHTPYAGLANDERERFVAAVKAFMHLRLDAAHANPDAVFAAALWWPPCATAAGSSESKRWSYSRAGLPT